MTVNGVLVETPKYDASTNKWYCPQCNSPVDIYDEDNPNYYYVTCSCGCHVANKNLMEARSE